MVRPSKRKESPNESMGNEENLQIDNGAAPIDTNPATVAQHVTASTSGDNTSGRHLNIRKSGKDTQLKKKKNE